MHRTGLTDKMVAQVVQRGSQYRTLRFIGKNVDSWMDWLASKVFNPSTVFSETVVAAVTFMAGVWVLYLDVGEIVVPSSDAVRVLESVAPEEVFGGAMLVCGTAGLVAVTCCRLRLRQWISLATAVLWFFITTVLLLRNLHSLTTAFCPFLCAVAAWAYLRLGVKDG